MSLVEADSAIPIDAVAAPPIFVRRVRISGYKSIERCDVTLDSLTILVGRNGAGKSNFLDALGFVRDAVDTNLIEAVKRRGGWKSIQSRATPGRDVSIELELGLPGSVFSKDSEGLATACYKFSLNDGFDEDSPIVTAEAFAPLSGCAEEHPRFSQAGKFDPVRKAGSFNFGVHPQLERSETPRPLPDQLYLTSFGADQPMLRHWIDGLRFMTFYNFNPAVIRKPQAPNPSPLLEEDGCNLAKILGRIQHLHPATAERIQAYLSSIVPEIARVEEFPIWDSSTLKFWMQTVPGLEFGASSMSDGTLRALALLVAAYQHQRRGPSLVGIEEPETSLHPAAIHALVDAMDEATGGTQIILTTHSAEMLDNPTVQPENVRVVQMVNGRTLIGNVDAASVEIVRRNLNTLGGLERENQFEFDIIPGSQQ